MTEPVREGKAAPSRLRRWRGIVAASVVAVAGTLAVAALHRPAVEDGRYTVVEEQASPVIATIDPLRAELVRCRALPPGGEDAACRIAWGESRRRFFGEAGTSRVPTRLTER